MVLEIQEVNDMKERLSWKKIFNIFRKEYVRWITDPKMIILLVLAVMVRKIIILPILSAAEQMNQPINGLEPCIALANSGLILLLIPLAYLVLMVDFPYVDDNMYFLMPRIGRRNWIIGEVLFQFFSLLTYLVFIIVSTILQVAAQSYWVNGWSLVTTDYDKQFAETLTLSMDNLLPLNLYYQMTPLSAFFASYGLLFVSLFLWSSILLLATLCGKKLAAFWGVLVSIAIGIGVCSLKTQWMWLFPVSHAIVWIHYQRYYREYVFSPWISVAILGVAVIIIYVCIIRRSRTVNLDILREEK